MVKWARVLSMYVGSLVRFFIYLEGCADGFDMEYKRNQGVKDAPRFGV